MCYHYSINKTATEIAERYNILPRLPQIDPFPVHYHTNGFDHEYLPIVLQNVKEGDLNIDFMQWGMVPAWVKGEEHASGIRSKTLNARYETIDVKPSFKHAFKYRPCLVPATGYFEWMHYNGKKYPFFIFIPDMEIFSFAGIWDEWISEQTGEILHSFAIITCEANRLTSKIHNARKRMPVILDPQNENEWLMADEIPKKKALLKPFDSSRMNAYTISRLITDRNRDSNIPGVVRPFKYPELNDLELSG